MDFRRWVGAALLGAPALALASEPVERESEWEQSALEAWEEPGFRLQLRTGFDSLTASGGEAPDAGGISIEVEPGVRLNRAFSLSVTLRYTVLSGGVDGLRWSTTADATWHPGLGFFLAAGLGYGGILGEGFLRDCDGSGVAVLGRTGWLIAAGEIFATGPVLQIDHQWTRCDSLFGIDEEDGSSGRRSTWKHRTLHLAWSFAWR